jgi:hypothetical protein
MTIQQQSSIETRPALLHRSKLVANTWNPNRMTPVMREKLAEAIDLFGFIDPLTVRPLGDLYQIIDGEHRFEVGVELGFEDFDAMIVEGLTDVDAKKLTIVMNELHGQADPDKLGPLIEDIISASSLEDLFRGFPYDEGVVASFLSTPLPPLPDLPKPKAASKDKEAWAERTYRMPKTVALVVDEAIEKAKDGEEIETWQALERVAADYLAT